MILSDYVIDFLESQKIAEVFLVTGGAIAFIVDSFKNRAKIKYVCMQHEQSAAMAADGYARIGQQGLGVAMATSGPGATNLITGICCSWFDSIPTLYITGQVNSKEQSGKLKVRQIGFQETNIVEIAKPITKFAQKLENANDIKYLLEKAVYIAKTQRPGPVLVDIPIDLQYSQINPKKLRGFNPKELQTAKKFSQKINISACNKLIRASKRPVVILGFGIRLSGAQKEAEEFINFLNFPTTTTWSGIDLISADNQNLIGQSGIYGSRAANFAIQNSDLLISIGARLDTRQTGSKPQNYARNAKKIVVDIDPFELSKGRGLSPNVAINTDVKVFLEEFKKQSKHIKKPDISRWQDQIKTWKKNYPPTTNDDFKQKNFVNPYVFIKILSKYLKSETTIVGDTGAALTWLIQAIEIKGGQRLISAFGNSPMGYALPASIGANFALKGKKPVVCITGDGGLQMNIQELQTIVHHKLPIKIFNLNNRSYGIIKQFQDAWLDSRYEASENGYSTPNFVKIAKAYGIKAVSIKNNGEIEKKLKEVMLYKGPVICDLQINPNQKITPKIEFGMPLEDMTPYLKREEFFKNMQVEPLRKSTNLK